MSHADDDRAAARADHAHAIIAAAIAAADPAPAVASALRNMPTDGARVHIVAIGKASIAMGRAALDVLPGAVAATIVAPSTEDIDVEGVDVRVLRGSHPLPDAASARAGAAVLAACAAAGADELVVVLISGGASALCIAPRGDISPQEYASVVGALMHAGATITELNTVRAHIDALKGGGMLRRIAPARALGLVVSDVVGSPLAVIASGPLTPATSTPADAAAVLDRYALREAVPESVRAVLREPITEPALAEADVRVILDNAVARSAAAAAARHLGYAVRMLPAPVTGFARKAGKELAAAAIDAARSLAHGSRPLCIVGGGETTVVVRGQGKGGRNQELALSAAIALDGRAGITIASAGTDGIDGPTDAAGAIADGDTVSRGRAAGRSATADLDDNDSHSFFTAAGGLIRIGATGTNVMDVQLALVDPVD